MHSTKLKLGDLVQGKKGIFLGFLVGKYGVVVGFEDLLYQSSPPNIRVFWLGVGVTDNWNPNVALYRNNELRKLT